MRTLSNEADDRSGRQAVLLAFLRRTADEMVDVELQFMEADIVDDVRHGRTHRRLRHGEVRTNSPS